jgi:SAM-dependent methyltransferase
VKSWIELFEDVKGLQSAHGVISVPRRIELPPIHRGLAREDTRRPTKWAVMKNRVKGMCGFSKRVLKACMPEENSRRYTFLSVPCTPALLDQFIVRTAIERALRETLDKFHGVLLDVGSKSKPYKSLLIAEAKDLSSYFALDLKPSGGNQFNPDIVWDGTTIPLINNAIGCAIATEVFEHLPEPETMMREILRVLKPGGILFFTVPFLWRLHTVPFDQYRYTPFSLERHLKNAGFANVRLTPLGGPDASLGQILALWAKGRSQNLFYKRLVGPVLSFLCMPLVWLLDKLDTRPTEFHEGCLITGLSGTAVKLDSISGK